jgi:DNA-3-methyladenine glycosylase I
MNRCEWAKNKVMIEYHDLEWGIPLHDDERLFEFLMLDAFQAGLSWEIILRKRDAFRQAFDQFEAGKIACYSPKRLEALLQNPAIIRNRLKIAAVATNAQAFLDIQTEFGSFDRYVWRFVGGKTIQNAWKELKDIPARTVESDALSHDLVQRGFKFAGSTICYAFMQAAGLVNDHLTYCFRYPRI